MCTSIVANRSVALSDSTDASQMPEVIVTGTRTATTTRNLPTTVSVVDRTTLTLNQRNNVLPTLMEQVPGLFVTTRGMMGYGVSSGAAGGISVRGLGSGNGQVLVLIDGHPQYNGIYGHSIADSYQTMIAERVEVLRGPASVLYGGNAMGGVVNIITRRPKADGVNTHINLGAGSWGTVQAEATNQVRKGRFTSTVAAQYGRTDNHRPRMDFEQYGAFAKLGYELSDSWRTFADIDITHFNASNPVRVDIDNKGITMGDLYEADMWITRGVATIGVENHYDKTNGRISAYHNWGRHKINDGYGPTYNNNVAQNKLFRSKDALTGMSVYQSLKLIEGNTATLGFDYQNIYADAYYTDRATGELLPPSKATVRKHMDEVALYADVRQDICRWLSADAGIRYDYHSQSGSEWVPQFGIVARPLATAELKLTASKGFRNPTPKDLFLYKMANEELQAERIYNYEISWHQRLFGSRLSYGANLFLLKGDNMIQTVSGKNVNTGEIANRGLELEAAWRVSDNLSLTTNHTFLHMRHHLVAAPKYKAYVGANARCGSWSLAAGLQQVCGLYTAAGTPDDPKESFTLLNLTIGYQVNSQVQLWAKGDNLLAQRYEINAGYPMPRATFMAGVNVRF